MTLEQAFNDLITIRWDELPKEYKTKYKSYRSKFLSPDGEGIGEKKMREMLLKAGFIENWKK